MPTYRAKIKGKNKNNKLITLIASCMSEAESELTKNNMQIISIERLQGDVSVPLMKYLETD